MSSTTTFDEFTLAYLEAALWASYDNSDGSGGKSLDTNYDVSDIAPETLTEMAEDCRRFQKENAADIFENPQRAGYDFWLTRNRHGAGFWDGGWEKAIGQRLTEASRRYGEYNLYVGDDELVHGWKD